MSNIENIKTYIDVLDRNGLLVETTGNIDVPVVSITFDSRKAKNNALFVCKGANFREEYLFSALKQGAVCYVCEKHYSCSKDATEIIVSDIRMAMPLIAETFYGKLSDNLKVIGITGTKGKSTITYFVKSIFDEYMKSINRKKIALCSGIRNYDGIVDEESKLTTPENFVLYERMNNAIKSGISHMVMEISSQALKYERTMGIELDIACFNNIGNDHISSNEHIDFEDYFNSKLKIFKQSRKACINMDSEHIEEILVESKGLYTVTYSTESNCANIFAYDIESNGGRIRFKVQGRNIDGYADFDVELELGTFGSFNISNALAAIAISVLSQIPMDYIILGLKNAYVPGRMQLFRSKDCSKLGIVDYAHNALSFEALLSSVRNEFPDREIIMTFGSTGDKAINRRKGIGKIASRYCKHIILTEDDSGSESVQDICKEIVSYFDNPCSYEIILDRPAAIRKMISMANSGNIVIAAGKSMEKHQNRGQRTLEIESDYEIFRKEFSNI